MDYSDKRLLIISNNVLSYTQDNGKTILSFFDSVPKECVRQLYFSGENPGVSGYKYFQISDNDIIKGVFSRKRRGRAYDEVNSDVEVSSFAHNQARKKTALMRLIRECLWYKKWISDQLINWLDEYKPTAIFFVAGDSLFAYQITEFIRNRYKSSLSVFITDDYVMPRTNESFLSRYRRKKVLESMKKCVTDADQFFTVSEPMRQAYLKLFNKDSHKIVNMTESMKLNGNDESKENDKITLIYAGGLYYGREDVLGSIGKVISQYNSAGPSKKAFLKIYTNQTPDQALLDKINIPDASSFCGSLDRSQLAVELNNSDILVFVESSDPLQKEKTRFSLSTKVTEYLSLGKPIFAVGPSDIGSMDYLFDVAECVFDESEIEDVLKRLLENTERQNQLGILAKQKYEKYHNKEAIQNQLLSLVFQEGDKQDNG